MDTTNKGHKKLTNNTKTKTRQDNDDLRSGDNAMMTYQQQNLTSNHKSRQDGELTRQNEPRSG